MKIKKLDIVGFKSFSDKASIQFPAGISAIVGPNGCGKSNVIDALRWVMGEQSVKQLRGKSTEDLIFSGATNKPPLNMAEVTLTMVNDNGHAPEEFRDYAEISVTRRLFRSGESAYLINRQPCRLKDIYNLFMGSGVGSRTFAIIQQGNIGAIIDSGPDERRLFLEEAAGVTRYKMRKNEALRKVKATENNLLRLNDIISEVNRQMAGLQRQAKKAERYKQYQERIQIFDGHLLLHTWDDFSIKIKDTEQLLRQHKDTDVSHVAQLKKIDAAVEAIKLARWQKNQEISTFKNNRFEAQRTIDRLESERQHLKDESHRLLQETAALEQARTDLITKTGDIVNEIKEIESRNGQLNTKIESLKGDINAQRYHAQEYQDQITTLNQALEKAKNAHMQLVTDQVRYKNIYQNATTNRENVARRLKRIDEDVALAVKKVEELTRTHGEAEKQLAIIQGEIRGHETRINELRGMLNEKSSQLGASVKEAHTLDLQRNKARSQLATLKKMAANFDWYRDGVKAVMQARSGGAADRQTQQLKGIAGLMADILEPEVGYEDALEAVLGEALQYILVDDQQAGAAAIDFLQAGGTGRCGFIPLSTVKPLQGADPSQIAAEHRLLDHVKVPAEYNAVAQSLLGHVAVVSTLEEALALFNRNGRLQSVATLAGDVVTHQGMLLGGSKEQLSGILAKKQELKTLAETCDDLDRQVAEAQARQQALEKNVRELESELQRNLAAKNHSVEEGIDAEKKAYRLGEDRKNARRHQEILELEQEQLLGEESDIDAEMSQYHQTLERIEREVQEAQAETGTIAQKIGSVSSQWEAFNQKIVDLKLALTSLNAKLENGQHTLQRLQQFERDSRDRLDQLVEQIDLKKEKQGTSTQRLADGEQHLNKLYADLRALEEKLSAQESDYAAIDKELRDHDDQLSAIKTQREDTLEKIRVVELDLSEKRIQRENIAGKVQDRYHCSIGDLRARQADHGEELNMSIEEMSQELERFRSRLISIGDVNLGAIKEYDELKERFDFLSTQRDDLVKALDDLHKVIRKINRITQERFMETYNQVNEKLKEVFPKLFDGGSARLELTEPGKPLETGVEYLVHPPGKKLTRMSLLSGGEKALSAIAFIFAIFLLRPASFCLLDEIDAPLDEANVMRFNNLMQVIGEKSQIVMITHNKKSMEYADTLYGVTMEQKGISKIVSVNLSGGQA